MEKHVFLRITESGPGWETYSDETTVEQKTTKAAAPIPYILASAFEPT
jgi:hypothetical protein